jgi:hypothetical protein
VSPLAVRILHVLAVLIVTGLVNLGYRPYFLEVPRFQVKLGLVVVALGIALRG